MYTLVTFATQWGTQLGGINSFNADFLKAFGVAYHHSVRIICVVSSHTAEAEAEAAENHVRLIALPYDPKSKLFNSSIGESSVELLKNLNLNFDPKTTVWLGHDLITGEAAIAAARIAGGASAVIHHMSYSDYESYAEESQSALTKTAKQTSVLQDAHLALAIGPLLTEAASDRISNSKPIHTLIPGLAEVDTQDAPNTFVAFLSGRLSENAARIKQAQLGVAAFALAEARARDYGIPEALRRQPKLVLRGVDFENQFASTSLSTPLTAEAELKKFAEQYGNGVINLHALPYTNDRSALFSELSKASVALMPSWHEGFGLVAWEAIAAGVPLIIGRNTGVYRLLERAHPGMDTGFVYALDLRGATDFPYFRIPEDLEATADALKTIAADPGTARRKASTLRSMLLDKYSWAACAEQAAIAFGWSLQKGSVPDKTSASIPMDTGQNVPSIPIVINEPLRIPKGHWRSGAGMADSQLLRAEEALVSFDPAREPEVSKLREWLNEQVWPISVRLLTGAGGEGKTRLAIQVCNEFSAAGWNAGFLDSNLESKRMKAIWQDLRAVNQPTLVVVDYAETRQEAFLSLLKAVQQEPSEQRVRMLLLARDGGEWWENLASQDAQCEALLSGRATSGPYRLPPLYTASQSRQEAFRNALRALAEVLEVDNPDVTLTLVGAQFERPLFVQMAALLALYGERATTSQGLTKALLNHERRYWLGLLVPFHWPDPARRAEQLLALATLAGGFATAKIAEKFWTQARGAVVTASEFNSLFRQMVSLYPGTQGLEALRPDLLGEALVAQALLRPEGDVLLDSVLGSSATQAVRRNSLTVLSRISAERFDVDEILIAGLSRQLGNCGVELVAVSAETAGRLPKLAEITFQALPSATKNQVAGSLRQSLKDESVQLAGLGCLIFEHLAEKARERLEKKPKDAVRMFQYAGAVNVYVVHLDRVGDFKRAIEFAQAGLETSRRLIALDRNRFEPIHAALLGNYANALSQSGHNDESRVYMIQVLEIYKRLAQENPERFEPPYAGSLSNLANDLSDVGQDEEALTHDREALAIRKRLAQNNPDRFEPDYATSLSNLASHLSDVGQDEEALTHDREALAIRKRLVQNNPDRFEPDYATSLSNLASHLSNVGQDEEALAHAREALVIRKRLAQNNPERFEPDYATSLSNLANRLGDVVQDAEALTLTREALAIRKRLAQNNPDRFEPDYATSLSNLASHLSNVGQDEEALAHSREALEIRKRLAQNNPDRFESYYAHSLSNLARHLRNVGQDEEALAHVREALEIGKRLAQNNPERFEPDYATSLSDLASHLSNAGQDEEALEHDREALEISKRLAQNNRDRFEPDYARSLSNLANDLSEVGQDEEALTHIREALAIRKRLAQNNPDRFEPDYATSLSNLASRLSDVGQDSEALTCAREALRIRKRLWDRGPVRFSRALFNTITFVGFLGWLTRESSDNESSLPNRVLTFIPSHQQDLGLLYLAFLEGCRALDDGVRKSNFRTVLLNWQNLSQADKQAGAPYRLCAVAWCAKFDSLPETEWIASFKQYSKRRHGRTPQWMLEVAQRLKIQFPE